MSHNYISEPHSYINKTYCRHILYIDLLDYHKGFSGGGRTAMCDSSGEKIILMNVSSINSDTGEDSL